MTMRTVWGARSSYRGAGYFKFPNVHEDARIDDSVIVFGDPKNLKVGAGSRIDAFCVLSVGEGPGCGIEIGRRTHVGCGCYLFGSSGKITVGDCCSLSPGVKVYTATDTGSNGLVGACIPDRFRGIRTGNVQFDPGSSAFTNAVVIAPSHIGTGAVVGAGVLVMGRDIPDLTLVSVTGKELQRHKFAIGDIVRTVQESVDENR